MRVHPQAHTCEADKSLPHLYIFFSLSFTPNQPTHTYPLPPQLTSAHKLQCATQYHSFMGGSSHAVVLGVDVCMIPTYLTILTNQQWFTKQQILRRTSPLAISPQIRGHTHTRTHPPPPHRVHISYVHHWYRELQKAS